MLTRRTLLASLAFAATSAPVSEASAEVFPSRQIIVVVPFPAGGPTDTIARIVSERMRTSLAQPIVIETAVTCVGLPTPAVPCVAFPGFAFSQAINSFKFTAAANPREAVAVAIHLAREGRIEGLMKASMSTEELIARVISSTNGLRTERRISHVHAVDIPTYPKPLFITDSMINIAPGPSEKRDICHNAIYLALWLGI